MEVCLAKSAGFCFGVERAVNTVFQYVETGRPIYTFGPIVHNEEVVRELEEKGVTVIDSVEEAKLCDVKPGSVMVIRAHGISKRQEEELAGLGFEIVDATCPFVKKIHHIVEEHSKNGEHIVVAGDPSHPEVQGIVGWCEGPVTVLQDAAEAEEFQAPNGKKICLVAQTTFQINKFQYMVDIFEMKGYNDSVVNTICNATEERQRAARMLAKEVDAMIVIGGSHSSNTRKLYEICREECEHTFYIKTLDDLHLELPKSVRLVGITAGASTPQKIIEEVQKYVRDDF